MRGDWIGRHCFPGNSSFFAKSECYFYIFLKQYKLYPVCQSLEEVSRRLQAADELLGWGSGVIAVSEACESLHAAVPP